MSFLKKEFNEETLETAEVKLDIKEDVEEEREEILVNLKGKTTARLNVREKPSIDSSKKRILEKNQDIIVLEMFIDEIKHEMWARIGEEEWVNANWVAFDLDE